MKFSFPPSCTPPPPFFSLPPRAMLLRVCKIHLSPRKFQPATPPFLLPSSKITHCSLAIRRTLPAQRRRRRRNGGLRYGLWLLLSRLYSALLGSAPTLSLPQSHRPPSVAPAEAAPLRPSRGVHGRAPTSLSHRPWADWPPRASRAMGWPPLGWPCRAATWPWPGRLAAPPP